MPEPKIAQKAPYVLAVTAGTYTWCACGRSQGQPYCDGSHEGTEFTPLTVTIDNDRTVAWCGCKHSTRKPFCDGSHNKI